jgi:hypothetical protein
VVGLASEACLPVWLPDPQDSLNETDEEGGGHSDQYLLDLQFDSTNPWLAPTHAVYMSNLPYILTQT